MVKKISLFGQLNLQNIRRSSWLLTIVTICIITTYAIIYILLYLISSFPVNRQNSFVCSTHSTSRLSPSDRYGCTCHLLMCLFSVTCITHSILYFVHCIYFVLPYNKTSISRLVQPTYVLILFLYLLRNQIRSIDHVYLSAIKLHLIHIMAKDNHNHVRHHHFDVRGRDGRHHYRNHLGTQHRYDHLRSQRSFSDRARVPTWFLFTFVKAVVYARWGGFPQ